MGSWSVVHWLIVLAVVTLIFGTSKLRSLGGDLGAAIKAFKSASSDADAGTAVEKNPRS
jgi:sec-independent protein translocase protein TatA